MIEAAKLRKGDRVQLPPATVVHCDNYAVVRFDGSAANDIIELGVLSKATVLPRELKVGDLVTVNGASAPIMLINGDEAVLRHDDEDGGSHLTIWHLPDLSLDPDHKDDGE